MKRDEQQPRERPSVFRRLVRVFPELVTFCTCGADGARMTFDGVDYELNDDGEWVAVED